MRAFEFNENHLSFNLSKAYYLSFLKFTFDFYFLLFCILSGKRNMILPYQIDSQTTTAVRKHCNDLKHTNNIHDNQIVGHASNKFHLRQKGFLLISMVNPTIINVQKKSIPLCVFGR